MFSFLEKTEAEKARPKTIRINNNLLCPWTFPPISGKKLPEGWGDVPEIVLTPGMNTVPRRYLEALEELSQTGRCPGLVKGFAKAFTLEVNVFEGPGRRRKTVALEMVDEDDERYTRRDGAEAPPELRAYGVDNAIILVRVEDDVSVLRMWLKNDGRSDITEAIERRLKELAA